MGTVTPVCRRLNFGFQSPTCYWAKRFRAHKHGTGYMGVRCDNSLRVCEINHPVNVPPCITCTNLRPSRICLPESLRARDRFFLSLPCSFAFLPPNRIYLCIYMNFWLTCICSVRLHASLYMCAYVFAEIRSL